MWNVLKSHWPEYFMEAFGLGCFMVSAGAFTILLFHPASPLPKALPDEFLRRALMGLAMGGTAVGIIYSPWGKRSGAHLNPAVTLTFFRVGKIATWDATFYVVAQFAGGVLGVALVAATMGDLFTHPSVNYVATLPGSRGAGAAFLGEAVISFTLMTVVLIVSNTPKLASFTGLFAGACVATFITFESPISGMSMNPARTFASAVWPQLWGSLWIYFVAPPLGMLFAAFVRETFKGRVACAKLHHQNDKRCIFCEHQHAKQAAARLTVPIATDSTLARSSQSQ